MDDQLETALLEADDRMEKALEFLHADFSGLRSGKASPALVEGIQVPYYGTPTRLKEIASISTPEPRLLVISPFDPTALPDIEKAITEANIGITPMNDGKIIRLPIPDLSEERRKDLLKVAKTKSEEQRIAIRNIRRETNDLIKAAQNAGTIGEDEMHDALETSQKETDDHIKKIDELLQKKEAEIMQV